MKEKLVNCNIKLEKRLSEESVRSLVTYLNADDSAVKAIKKGDLEKSKKILLETAQEHVALKVSKPFIQLMTLENGAEIVETIRTQKTNIIPK